jgi:hypothetical protein
MDNPLKLIRKTLTQSMEGGEERAERRERGGESGEERAGRRERGGESGEGRAAIQLGSQSSKLTCSRVGR